MNTAKVFISYSHDSDEHRDKVRGLHASLCRDGCDAQLNVFKDTDEDWPLWMSRQVQEAYFALCVATEICERRFRDKELPDVGLGVGWEAGLIRRETTVARPYGTVINARYARRDEELSEA